MTQGCTKCIEKPTSNVYRRTSFLSTFLIIIIPKCPFCIMAYTSAISICGGADYYMTTNNWVSYIPLVLSVLIFGLLLMNKRGKRTYLSIALCLLGSLFILGTLQTILEPAFYNLGAALLVLAVWLNGNMFSFISFLRSTVRNFRMTWQK